MIVGTEDADGERVKLLVVRTSASHPVSGVEQQRDPIPRPPPRAGAIGICSTSCQRCRHERVLMFHAANTEGLPERRERSPHEPVVATSITVGPPLLARAEQWRLAPAVGE